MTESWITADVQQRVLPGDMPGLAKREPAAPVRCGGVRSVPHAGDITKIEIQAMYGYQRLRPHSAGRGGTRGVF